LFFFRVFFNTLSGETCCLRPIISYIASGSIFIGSFGAYAQTKIKRFIAYTSINQVGLILTGILSCDIPGFISSLGYLLLYASMNLGFFTIVLNMRHLRNFRSIIYINEMRALCYYDFEISVHAIIIFFCMSGLPPIAGFIGKFNLYVAIAHIHQDFYLFVVLFINIISSYYYLNLLRFIFFSNSLDHNTEMSSDIDGYFLFNGDYRLYLLLRCLSVFLICYSLLYS
jgi:NADH-quinone oxidoreductase subunit N